MTLAVSITESNVKQVLRSFLLGIMPGGVEVISGLDNRVPEPVGADFIVMTPNLRMRLSTNHDSYIDANGIHERVEMQPTQMTVQLDVHGPSSGDNAQIISTLLRDGYACEAMGSWGFDIQPLYAGDPHQVPFINGESQLEERWVVDAVLQVNPVVAPVQDFADAVTIGLIDVDAVYPP